MKLTFKNLLKEFKKNNHLDFRINKYYIRSEFYNYKSTVYFDYDFAEKIVIKLNDFLENKFKEKLVIFNTKMDIESLKYQTLYSYIDNRITNYIETNQIINNNKN